MNELTELRQEMTKMEERILTVISTLGNHLGSDLSSIREALEIMGNRLGSDLSSTREALEIMGDHLGSDLSSIREALEIISTNHLAPDHQKEVRRALANMGRR